MFGGIGQEHDSVRTISAGRNRLRNADFLFRLCWAGNRRQCGDQLFCEGVDRVEEDFLRSVALHDLSGIEQGDAMAERIHGSEVMRDKQDAHSQLAIQVRKQGEYLRLGYRVERGRWLVRDQQLWPMKNGHGDEDALRLSHADLRRMASQKLVGVREADVTERS